MCAWQIDDMSYDDDVVKQSAHEEFCMEVRRMMKRNDHRRAAMRPTDDATSFRMRDDQGESFLWVAEVNGYVHWPADLWAMALRRAR